MIRCACVVFLISVSIFILAPGSVRAEDPPEGADPSEAAFTEQEALFDELEASAEETHADRAAILEDLWNRMEAEEEAKWEQLEKEVLLKWDEYHQLTKKVWVDYAADRNSLSRVDFEKGKVTVEVLVPAEAQPSEAKIAIQEKVSTLMKAEDGAGDTVMEDMLPAETEAKISAKELEISEPQEVEGKDGVNRKKVSVTLTMVPDHVQRRAERFLPRVIEESDKSGVDPALILAVIQTESAFNPKARSHVPAFGLMQIVPRFAGKEAYQALYGEEKVLTPEYLYNPDNNILMGATYLKILHETYFAQIESDVKRRYVAVCAYNWGPTAMRRRLLPRLEVENMSEEELFEGLLAGVPKETQNYLKRVEKRRAMYDRTLAVQN